MKLQRFSLLNVLPYRVRTYVCLYSHIYTVKLQCHNRFFEICALNSITYVFYMGILSFVLYSNSLVVELGTRKQ